MIPPDPILCNAVRLETHLGDLWLPTDDEVIRPYIESSGSWEPSEEQLLTSLMKPDTHFLDVGANVGYFSVLASRICPAGTIDAVEPDPRNVALCRMNLWRHAPHAQVWPIALGESRNVVGLRTHERNAGDTRVAPSQNFATQLAAVAAADDLFSDRTFDLIKIDVQGYEREVLLGMRRLIERSARIAMVVEFFPAAIRDRGRHPLEVLRIYRDLGLQRAASVQGKLLPLDDSELLGLCERAGPEGFVNLVLRK